ncbi:MAG: transketolase family protein [Treponema sp.]|jgi:transketolase|nr:transketolase family protein [Treponema sp.]
MEKCNQRTAYGETLVALGAENPDIVVLEADLGKSTMSSMFQAAYPDRYFEMGIAEANMISTAAGLTASGKIAFCSSFAVFASGRAYDQIRQTVAIGRLNVKICGSSCGLSDFGDGSTHQAVEDIAIMTAIPNMTVFTPADAEELRMAVRAAAAIEGPVYIRVIRCDVPTYTNGEFTPGKLSVLRPGSANGYADATIISHGIMTEAAMNAADILQQKGISVMVINAGTMKPFDSEGIVELSKKVKAIVTAEDHSRIGGLASAAAFALRKSATPMDYVAIEDQFGQSAHSLGDLLEHYGLTAEAIAGKITALLN